MPSADNVPQPGRRPAASTASCGQRDSPVAVRRRCHNGTPRETAPVPSTVPEILRAQRGVIHRDQARRAGLLRRPDRPTGAHPNLDPSRTADLPRRLSTADLAHMGLRRSAGRRTGRRPRRRICGLTAPSGATDVSRVSRHSFPAQDPARHTYRCECCVLTYRTLTESPSTAFRPPRGLAHRRRRRTPGSTARSSTDPRPDAGSRHGRPDRPQVGDRLVHDAPGSARARALMRSAADLAAAESERHARRVLRRGGDHRLDARTTASPFAAAGQSRSTSR